MDEKVFVQLGEKCLKKRYLAVCRMCVFNANDMTRSDRRFGQGCPTRDSTKLCVRGAVLINYFIPCVIIKWTLFQTFWTGSCRCQTGVTKFVNKICEISQKHYSQQNRGLSQKRIQENSEQQKPTCLERAYCIRNISVSYTHLDVYKRQF